MKKRIAIDQLKPGMYLAGFDKSWFATPFLSHKRLIQDPEDIARLRQYEIHEVLIDTTQGDDVEDRPLTVSPEPNLIAEAPPPLIQPDLMNLAEELRAVWAEATAAVEKVFAEVRTTARVDARTVRHVGDTLRQSILQYPEASLFLTRMRQTHAGLFAHAVDTCILTLLLGQQLKLDSEQLDFLAMGALLHDIGQLSLPLPTSQQPLVSSEEEREVARRHPKEGALLLTQSVQIPTEVRRIVAEHHERINGSGYPAGSTGGLLSPLSQVVSLSDVYTSLCSGYEGTQPLSVSQVLQQLEQFGTTGQFDRALVTQVVQLFGEASPDTATPPFAQLQTNGLPSADTAAGAPVSSELPGPGIDLSAALTRLGGDRTLLNEVIELFLKESPRLLAQIQTAITQKEAKTLELSAHSLKGAAGDLGATATFEAAFTLENMGRQGDFEQAPQTLGVLEQELNRLKPALQTFKDSAHAPASPPQTPRKGRTAFNPQTRMLLVDGVLSSRVMLHGLLRNLGVKTVHQAEDGRTALEKLRQHTVDVVISDWQVPGMQGVGELLQAIRRHTRHKDIPFLVITGSATRNEVLEAMRVGVKGYLLRPFNMKTLEERLYTILHPTRDSRGPSAEERSRGDSVTA